MRILIAEDSLTQAVDLRRRLEAMGHEVVVAGDGLQAWKLIQARPERLVITDWMMPEMNGLELCRKIRGELTSRYVYTILLTVKSHRHERLQGLNAGADDFLSKPIDSVELEIALKAAQRIISAQEALQTRARELEQAMAELARVATHDELTGLLNGRGFEEALVGAFGRAVADQLPLSLAVVEIDDVDRVRSGVRPEDWDRFLADLGRLCREVSRDCDLPARVGKHGFALILPGLATDSAHLRRRGLADRGRPRSVPDRPGDRERRRRGDGARPPLPGRGRACQAGGRGIARARAEGGDRLVQVDSTST